MDFIKKQTELYSPDPVMDFILSTFVANQKSQNLQKQNYNVSKQQHLTESKALYKM